MHTIYVIVFYKAMARAPSATDIASISATATEAASKISQILLRSIVTALQCQCEDAGSAQKRTEHVVHGFGTHDRFMGDDEAYADIRRWSDSIPNFI
eukprot:COSAG02_NODE_6496_length_3537_cov_10.709715_1_plen_96_part_10